VSRRPARRTSPALRCWQALGALVAALACGAACEVIGLGFIEMARAVTGR
jgi:hypothetical protein